MSFLLPHPYWRYYWIDLPLFAYSGKPRLPDAKSRESLGDCIAGAAYLRSCLAPSFCAASDEEIAARAQLCRLWREAMPFRLALGQRPAHRLQAPADFFLPGPRLLLTAHFGSFFAACVAFAQRGLNIDWLARSPDHSALTPRAERAYLRFNYWATARAMEKGKFLFTDFQTSPARSLIETLRSQERILGALLDLPPHLYSTRRLRVEFLGRASWLPSALISHACAKGVRIYTAFYRFIETSEDTLPAIEITVESLPEKAPGAVLQSYAHRLTTAIAHEPWLWMGLPIAASFHREDRP
ncbi:MAG: hypothetical protein N2441_06390 [Rhodocyclaceae bacterium]|nr:hypothetical protein [Rhodocyclaceae bacterium]